MFSTDPEFDAGSIRHHFDLDTAENRLLADYAVYRLAQLLAEGAPLPVWGRRTNFGPMVVWRGSPRREVRLVIRPDGASLACSFARRTVHLELGHPGDRAEVVAASLAVFDPDAAESE